MASDAIARLHTSVQQWNHWRIENPTATIDFKRADFSGKDLSGADLRHADLRGAILRGTALSRSSLASARLSGADLSGASFDLADLSLADARGAYFIYSTARKANMRQINLNGANLTGADLQGADLHSAILLETVLVDANLCGACGLEKCDQPGPSIIDYRTIVRSNGLPKEFLRGCGLPDELIATYVALKRGAISCFLSYSSKDDVFVRKLTLGVARTWRKVLVCSGGFTDRREDTTHNRSRDRSQGQIPHRALYKFDQQFLGGEGS